MKKITSITTNLCTCYSKLIQSNSNICNTIITAEIFENLIDQRDIISEDIAMLCNQILAHPAVLEQKTEKPNDPFKALFSLAKTNTELASEVENLKKLLEELIVSNEAVEELINNQKAALKSEIHKLRRGAKKLRGYIQKTYTGSCFINKIK